MPREYAADKDQSFFHSPGWGESIYNLPGGTTGERFVRYLKETLLPTLRPGDIVVMDNIRSHHVKAVREILEAQGMKALYLPPYSPDLKPIEKCSPR